MAQALVPLKDLVQAKSRLAGLLRPSERRALAQAMVEDVLSALSTHSGIANITLLSDDPGAGLLAQKYRADCWPEATLGCRGLNALIQRASERLLATGEQPLIVLHADLPLLTGDDISAVLTAQRESGGLVIGCDRPGTGTNLLAFDAGSYPRFCFGENSCARHTADASGAGVPVRILQRTGISMDVDVAADLKCLMDSLRLKPASHSARLLHETALGARVKLALAAMSGGAAAGEAQAIDDGNKGISH